MSEEIRLFAGDCTTTFEGAREQTQRGYVVVLVKPDGTVLVHDADGYQPVAWLTRADAVTVEADDYGFAVTARTDDQTLRVVSNEATGHASYPITSAGVPVGDCPDCGGTLVRSGGDVRCLDCEATYSLPAGAAVLEETCDDCGLPRMRVERGATFECCIDYSCESLDNLVRDEFDREWTCPDCGSDLRVRRAGGGPLLAGCDDYPACDTAFTIPAGVVGGDCDCGLPIFETARGRRCLDGTCERFRVEE